MKKKIFKTFSVVIFLCLVSGLVGISVMSKAQDASKIEPAKCEPNASKLLSYVNAEREKLGAQKLKIDTSLAVASRQKLDDMVKHRYYGHDSVDGKAFSALIRKQGVKAAISQDINENALSAKEDWKFLKGSKAHYASLTDPQYTRVGLASKCVHYTLKTATGPDDNSSIIGEKIRELTVINLAGKEPKTVTTQGTSTRYKSSPSTCSTYYTPAKYIGDVTIPGYSNTYCD